MNDAQARPAAAGTLPEPARFGPRIVALIIDWIACSLIAAAFLGYTWNGSGTAGFAPLAVFVVENVLLVGFLGTTLGHRIVGLHVRRLDGRLPGPLLALVRSLGIALVIPALIRGSDGRSMHDRLAGTTIVRSRD